MKTRTSLAFDAMSGTAGEVTARSTRFGTILSGRARQPGRVTPQQKDMRALFARVGRSFKRLTVKPTTGSKYFIETSWMDVATGLSGQRRTDDRICQTNL